VRCEPPCNGSHQYHLSCLECCSRLVLSARPSRPHQEAMLHHIESHRVRSGGGYTRSEIVAHISVLKKSDVQLSEG